MKISKQFIILFALALSFLSALHAPGAPATSVFLSNDPLLQTPFSLATDGTNLFVSGAGPDGHQGIFTVPASGGAAVQIYSAYNPQELAFVQGNIFWIDPNSGPVTDTQIFRAPADGSGPVTAIYTGSSAGEPIVDGHGLATDGFRLFAADEVQGTVFSLNTDGSQLTRIGGPRYAGYFNTEHENGLACAAGLVFIADSGKPDYSLPPSVLNVPPAGGNYTTLATGSPQVQSKAVCVCDNTIFISDPGAGNTIWQMPITGGTPTPLVSGPPFQQIAGLVCLKGDLYVADPGARAIFRVALNTPPVLAINRSGQNVILSWPTNVAGFRLQSSTSIAPLPVWSFVTAAPVIIGGQNIVTLPISDPRMFFRLCR